MGEVRWLTGEEQRTWRVFLDAHRALFERFDRQLQRDAGIPLSYYDILVQLSETPDRRLRMSTLAERSGLSRSRLSHAVSRLERAGWVRRIECPTDRRGSFAVLTDSGYAVLEAAAPGHVETVRSLLFDPLSDEQVRQLHGISEAVLERACDGVEAAEDDERGMPGDDERRMPGSAERAR